MCKLQSAASEMLHVSVVDQRSPGCPLGLEACRRLRVGGLCEVWFVSRTLRRAVMSSLEENLEGKHGRAERGQKGFVCLSSQQPKSVRRSYLYEVRDKCCKKPR